MNPKWTYGVPVAPLFHLIQTHLSLQHWWLNVLPFYRTSPFLLIFNPERPTNVKLLNHHVKLCQRDICIERIYLDSLAVLVLLDGKRVYCWSGQLPMTSHNLQIYIEANLIVLLD